MQLNKFLVMMTITIVLAMLHDALPSFFGYFKEILLIIALISGVYTFKVAMTNKKGKYG